jgi:hypothetical protein
MSEDEGAAEILCAAIVAALAEISGLNGAYDGPPLQAALPYAIVEAGPESDWSHKSGAGREVRIAVTLRDGGERPARLRALARGAEAAIESVGGALDGWQLVTLIFLRSRVLREPGAGWAAAIDYRARLLKT